MSDGEDKTVDLFAGFTGASYKDGVETPFNAPEAQEAQPADDTEQSEGAEADDAGAADEDSTVDGEAESQDSDASDEAPKPKPKKSAQERISELTRARRDAERRAADLETRLAALERGEKPAAEKAPAKPEPQADAPKKPDPKDFDYGELDSDYIAAVVEYQTDLKLAKREKEAEAKRQAQAAAAEQQELASRYADLVKKGVEVYDDFEEKVIDGVDTGTWKLSEDLAKLILTSDAGADIAYHLASNPSEAAGVFGKSPLEQAAYFGRLEAKFSASEPVKPSQTRATQAPPPPKYQARGAGGKFQPAPDTQDFAAFEALAMQKAR